MLREQGGLESGCEVVLEEEDVVAGAVCQGRDLKLERVERFEGFLFLRLCVLIKLALLIFDLISELFNALFDD